VGLLSSHINHTNHAVDRIIEFDQCLWHAEGISARISALRLSKTKDEESEKAVMIGDKAKTYPGSWTQTAILSSSTFMRLVIQWTAAFEGA
jgi:hypothetical protein